MTSLNKPTLGTDPIKGWALYPIHLATSYVNDEYFLATRYKSSIANAEHYGKELEHKIAVYEIKFEEFPHKVSALNQAYDLSTWALKMKEEIIIKSLHMHLLACGLILRLVLKIQLLR